MQVLEFSKLFSGLSAAELEALKRDAQVLRFPPGHHIFQEGDQGDGVYMVREGRVQVTALVSPGARRILSRLGPGEFFGEMAVLDNEPRSATVITEYETSLYFIPRAVLLQILENSPKLAVNLVREFSFRLRDFNRQYIREVLQAERLALVGRFARSIIHDIKNPLNIIGLATEMAAMETIKPELRVSALHRIGKQVDRLNNMINELLEFTRGSQSPGLLADLDYAAYVGPILDELRAEVSDKGVVLEVDGEIPSTRVRLDPKRLTHVFFNLVQNAVEAMPNGGTVKIRCFSENGRVVTEISDTGSGIASEILPHLFEAFATHGKSKGTGLGLSICKKIIEDHRGEICARNQDGRGAIFSFSLPAGCHEPAQ